MMTVHITRDLHKRLSSPDFEAQAQPTAAAGNKLHTFAAKDFMVGRKRLVLAVNQRTRLALLISLAPRHTWLERLGMALERALLEHGVNPTQARLEGQSLQKAALAKNNDRSLVGSLNDLASHCPHYLAASQFSERDLLQAQHKLNQTPHLSHQPTFVAQGIAMVFGELLVG